MRMKRLLLILISLILILAAFMQGCNSQSDSGGDGVKTNNGDSSGTGDNSSETASPGKNILVENLKNYVIVRPEKASNEEIEAAKLIYNALINKFSFEKITIKDDFFREGDPKFSPAEYEIIVGLSNRDETSRFKAGLRADDYGYTIDGEKIVIFGYNGENTYAAAEKFVSDIIGKGGTSDIFMTPEDAFVKRGEYAIDSFTLGGVAISDYTIIYGNNTTLEKSLANSLSDYIAEKCGFVVSVTSDKSEQSAHEMLIGVTSRSAGEVYLTALGDNECYIGASGGNVYVWATNTTSMIAAVNKLCAMIDESIASSRKAVLELTEKQIFDTADDKLTAMTFNVLVRDIVSDRVKRVVSIVNTYLPDTVGFQEANPTWMNHLKRELSTYYSYVGEGRDGGNAGEYNPIFYRKDKFTLIESGTKWLSKTPDRVSKFSESSLNRILTYAVLKRNSDGKVFVHVNTHLEHTSSAARVKQAGVLVEFLEKYSQYPLILTGDFNCKMGTEEYNIIKNSFVENSFDVAEKKGNLGATFHNYGSSDSIIDFIFVRESKIIVTLYSVANEKVNGDYASDHHPVYIEYSITG